MTTVETHADNLDRLAGQADWSGLLRYWMAHDGLPQALAAAINVESTALLRRLAATQLAEAGPMLASFLGTLGDIQVKRGRAAD